MHILHNHFFVFSLFVLIGLVFAIGSCTDSTRLFIRTDINECDYPSIYPCINGNCINTIGSYNCSCPGGTESKDPKNITCTPVSDTNKQPQVKVVIGIYILHDIYFLKGRHESD